MAEPEKAPLRVSAAYIGLGSNLGDARGTLVAAVEALAGLGDVEAVSGLYETDPIGYEQQPVFLNAAVRLRWDGEPLVLLDRLLGIEALFGRERAIRFGPRTLDLDLLAVPGVECDTERLTLPHPRLTEREFALRPLADIAPDLVVSGRSVRSWLVALPPQGVRPAGRLMPDVGAADTGDDAP
jgi:2-amino-4-hydroxy-6-hydroxymethyldihydropteridine diphosphokinase